MSIDEQDLCRRIREGIAITDSERLDWLQKQEGSGLISDDFGKWAVSCGGSQNLPDVFGDPFNFEGTFEVRAEDWRDTIRAAIDEAISRRSIPETR